MLFKKSSNEEKEILKNKALADKSPEAYVGYVNKEFTNYTTQRSSLEAVWFQNIAMVMGYQNHEFNTSTREFVRKAGRPGRVRLIANKLVGYHLKQIAKLTKTPPAMFVRPDSSSDEDIRNAQLSEDVIEMYIRLLNFDRLKDQRARWALNCGSAFMHVYWDPEAGEDIPDTSMKIGDIRVDVLSPFEVFGDIVVDGTEKLERFIKATIRPVNYIYRKYGVAVKPEHIRSTGRFFTERIANINMGKIIPTNTDQSREESAVIKEMWIKPNAEHPEGLVITVAGNKLLKEPHPIPNKKGKFGLFKYDDIEISGRLFGQSKHELATPIQLNRNRIISQIVESRNATGRGKWALEKGSGLKKSNINSLTEDVLEYNAGSHAPTFVSPPTLPHYILEEIRRCDQDLMEIYTQTLQPDFVPPGVTSGRAIGYLQEENDTVYGPVSRQWENNDKELFRMVLELAQDKVKEPRKLPIISGRVVSDITEFIGSDIVSTDVDIEPGSSLPQSKTAQKLVVNENFDKGWYGDPMDPNVRRHGQKMMGIGRNDRFLPDEEIEWENALKEAQLLSKGQPAPFDPVIDIHEMHVAVLTRYLREKKYTLNQMQYQMIMEHRAMHEQIIQQKAMEEQAAADEQMQRQAMLQQGINPDAMAEAQAPQMAEGTPPPTPVGPSGPPVPPPSAMAGDMPLSEQEMGMVPGGDKMAPYKVRELIG